MTKNSKETNVQKDAQTPDSSYHHAQWLFDVLFSLLRFSGGEHASTSPGRQGRGGESARYEKEVSGDGGRRGFVIKLLEALFRQDSVMLVFNVHGSQWLDLLLHHPLYVAVFRPSFCPSASHQTVGLIGSNTNN